MNSAAPVNAPAAAAPMVLTEVNDKVGVITLNNVAKRNALSAALLDAVIAALAVFKDQQVRVVILRAAPGLKV
jgi:methylmalonyl-CoA decarboxylase